MKPRHLAPAFGLAVLCLALVSLSALAASDTGMEWPWELPQGFRAPWVPAENPLTPAKVELGRHLFYDVRLSGNQTQSCGTCHRPELAFTDGLARAVGSTGVEHPRSSMGLLNVAYVPRLTWADPDLSLLEVQALVPLLGNQPVEMGLRGAEQRFLDQARSDATYRRLFAAAFPENGDAMTLQQVTTAIASFERSLVSFRSPYDRYRYGGEADAIPEAAQRGELLFFSGEKGGCFQCHGGINFGGAVRTATRPDSTVEFHNTGLYNLAGAFSYPTPNRGIYEHTHRAEDVGKFRAPTLRNIAVTAPYMHDGSIATLEEALAHYAAGGRTIVSGPYTGVGAKNPNRSASVHPLHLSESERADLIAFLESLTDEAALHDPRWQNPWPAGSAARSQ